MLEAIIKFSASTTNCPNCGSEINDLIWKLLHYPEPPGPDSCATCTFSVWWKQRPDAHSLLELVAPQKLLQLADQRAIAAVFLSAALETLFEAHLWDLLKSHGTHNKVAELLLDSHRGRERRISLYNQLTPHTLKHVLDSVGLTEFLPAWKKLADARNGTVHGHWQSAYELDMNTIEYLRDNCYSAFNALHAHARTGKPPQNEL